jgi:tetratricopeptide (TPR) repeat protein
MRKYGLRPDDRPEPSGKARTSDASTPTPSSPGQPLPEPTGVRWETRLLTFLRAELIGLDDEAVRVGSSRSLDVITEKIRSFGGRVEDLSPRAAVGVFGMISGEDAPVRAALAAIAVQKAVPRTSTRGVRVALHLADLLVAESAGMTTIEMEGKRAVSTALDDVLTATEPGAVAVTSGLALSLRRRFHLAPAVAGFGLLGPRVATIGLEGRLAAFVGRNRELEILRDRFEAAARGQGQIVGILGEPGIGKSRLLYEFRRSIGQRAIWLEAHGTAHAQSTPYAPVLDLFRSRFAIGEDDEPAQVGEALRQGLQRIDPSLEQALPALLGLFGIANVDGAVPEDARERRQRITEALRALIVAASRKTPQVLAVEDIHWIDASSFEILQAIAGTIARMPVLIVTTQRPGTAVPWASKAMYAQIALGALGQLEVEALAVSLLGVQQLPSEFTRVLADKAEGNPLLVEEITASLVERGALVQEPDTIRWLPGVRFEIPSTLRDVMRARVDRLDAAVRHTLQTASVIGRDFSRRILERVTDTPSAVLDDHLMALVGAELVHPTDYSDEEFVFKHSLLHDAVYEAVPEKKRLLVHRLVGSVLEALWQHRTDEVSAQLAYHFDRGGEPSRALHWSATAGDRARCIFANREALSFYDRALALADDPAAGATSARRLHLHRSRGQTRSLQGDYPGAAEDFRLGRTLAQAAGDVIAEAIALSGSARMAMFDGRYDIAIADAREALRLARAADDQVTIARSLITLGDIHIHGIRGGDEEGVRYLDEALPLCRNLGDHQGLAESLCHLGYIHLLRGSYPTSTSLFEESAALARKVDDRQRLVFDLIFLGIVRMDLADFREAARLLKEGIETAEAIEARGLAAVGRTFLGWVEIKRANHIEAKALLEEALATFEAAGAKGWIPLVLDIQGEQLCRLGALEEARGRFERALPLGREVADPCWQSFALTGLAYCAGMDGHLEEARAHLEESLAFCEYKSDMWVRCRAQALVVWADVLLAGRDAGAALEVTRTLLDFVCRHGMRQLEGEARRLRGRALALLGETTAAEAELKTAVELAQALDDPLLCRDAALALARICEDLGRAETAREAEDLARDADDRLRRQALPAQGTSAHTPSP